MRSYFNEHLRRFTVILALASLGLFIVLPAYGQRGGFGRGGSRGGFGPGYYRNTGYTPAQVRNTYAAMGYRPYGLTTPGYGYGYNSAYWWPYGGGYSPYYSGYYPYSWYYPYNYGVNYNISYNPSEYLEGAASVYNAQGNFLVKKAEAEKLQAEARSAQLENQRKAFDQALYEREHTPTAAEIRQKELDDAYRRSMADPPISLIISGQALNDLLIGLAQKLQSNPSAPQVPLDQSQLRQISVTTTGERANAGLLQQGGKLDWPVLLRGPQQRKLDELLPAAVNSVVMRGAVDPRIMDQINDELDKLTDHLDSQVNSGEITPNQHIQANRFLNNLKSALRALRAPNAADYFNGKNMAKGDSVPELVSYMMQNNLRFAPAMNSQDDAYVNLHRAMVAQAMQIDHTNPSTSGSGFRVRVGPNLPEAQEAAKKP